MKIHLPVATKWSSTPDLRSGPIRSGPVCFCSTEIQLKHQFYNVTVKVWLNPNSEMIKRCVFFVLGCVCVSGCVGVCVCCVSSVLRPALGPHAAPVPPGQQLPGGAEAALQGARMCGGEMWLWGGQRDFPDPGGDSKLWIRPDSGFTGKIYGFQNFRFSSRHNFHPGIRGFSLLNTVEFWCFSSLHPSDQTVSEDLLSLSSWKWTNEPKIKQQESNMNRIFLHTF